MVAGSRNSSNCECDKRNDFALCISLVKLEGQIPTSLATQIFPNSQQNDTKNSDLSIGVDLSMKNERHSALPSSRERLLSTKLSVVEENPQKGDFQSKETIACSKKVLIDNADEEDFATVVGVWDEAPVLEKMVDFGRQSSSSTSTLSTTGNTFEIPLNTAPTDSGFTAQLDLTSVVSPTSSSKKRLRQEISDSKGVKWGTVELKLAPETLKNLAQTVPPPPTDNIVLFDDDDEVSQENTPDAAEPPVYPSTLSLTDALSPESDHVDMRLPVVFKGANDFQASSNMVLHLRVKMQHELLLAIRNGVVRAKQVEEDPVMSSSSFEPPHNGSTSNTRLLGCLGPDFFDLLKHFLCMDRENQENTADPVEPMTCATAFAANDPNAITRTVSICSSIDTCDKYSPGPPFDPKKEVRVEIASWVEPPKLRQDNPFFNESIKA